VIDTVLPASGVMGAPSHSPSKEDCSELISREMAPQYAAGDLPDRSIHAPHPDHIIDVFLESNDDEY
jgi:hypothetical protein